MTGDRPLPQGCSARCRACDHRHLDLGESESRKVRWLLNRLEPWADRLAPIEGVRENESWGYRDRVRLRMERIDGQWRFGMSDGDTLLPIEACPAHSPRVRLSLALLGEILPRGPFSPLAFYVQSGAQVTLVSKTKERPDLTWVRALEERREGIGIEGLWLHLHPSAGRRLFANREWILLWGKGRSRGPTGLHHGPCAFQQLMPRLYDLSLDEAEAFLSPCAGDIVVDLYCGLGASLSRWSRRGAVVIGVELSGEALENAALNCPEALLLRGCCAERIPQIQALLDRWKGKTRLAYVNPPRTGLERPLVDWFAQRAFRRMAYLSCNAATLARDLALLEEAGYGVVRIRPYDFFPRTHHVETLALLEGRGSR